MDFTQTGGRIAAFFDLDGTLALGNRPPSPQDAEAIRAMRAAGHLAFLCTGRARGFLYPAVTDIGFDGIVAGAGAHITVGDKTLLRRSLGPETLRLIIAHFLHTGQTCVLEGERGMYLINDRANLPAEWPRVKTRLISRARWPAGPSPKSLSMASVRRRPGNCWRPI